MNRREFLKLTFGIAVAGVSLAMVSGCAARINESVYQKDQGSPWRCSHCGYLTRSKEDLSDTSCPRCMRRDLEKISEQELEEAIKKDQE